MIFFFVLILSICALIYEFLLATMSSYLIGNSVLQFSLTVGLFLTGLGVGSFFSRYVKNFYKVFYFSEIILGIVGGMSIFLIKIMYIYFFNYMIVFYGFYFFIVLFIGSLVGLEIPILGNIASNKLPSHRQNTFKTIISDVFTYDYIGALVATFLFPFVFLPWLGLSNTAILLGFFNLFIAFAFINEKSVKPILLQNKLYKSFLITLVGIIVVYLIGSFYLKNRFEGFWDHFFYQEPIVLKKQSKYQEIVITKRGDDIRLLLDGHLQFLSLDERRYHSGLWLLPNDYITKSQADKQWNILILGGGDGLLARNVLETFSGRSNFELNLIDIDKDMTDVAKTNEILLSLNKSSLNHPKVNVINQDAFAFLTNSRDNNKQYDIVIADFTDPRDVGVAKLYSKEFYLMINSILKKDGMFLTQAGNAFFAKESFWCIHKTLTVAMLGNLEKKIVPYRVFVPSFGDWGFIAMVKTDYNLKDFESNSLLNFRFDNDYLIDLSKIDINTIESPKIMNYYREGRKRFNL